jgi:hypothetical protein
MLLHFAFAVWNAVDVWLTDEPNTLPLPLKLGFGSFSPCAFMHRE